MANKIKARLQILGLPALEEVYHIEQTAQHFPWSKASLYGALQYNHVIGAYHNNAAYEERLIGFCILLDAVDSVELLDIAIDPLYQRQGYGSLLLHEVFNFALQSNISQVFLEVGASNQAALQFYQRQGFVGVRLRKAYYQAGAYQDDALIMVWQKHLIDKI